MCQTPNRLSNGVQVACHKCWQCINAKVDDWSGRCIAESKTAVGSHAVTLTYGRDLDESSTTYGDAEHERAAVLTYSDVQKWLKLFRRHGYPLRYFVTGEYGSAKGRAHWHVMVFWTERVPPIQHLRKRFLHERLNPATGEPVILDNGKVAYWWPHGTSFFDAPSFEAVRYNMKYINKDIGVDERQGFASMSKQPPLGAEYFRQLACRYVAQGLSPHGSQVATYDGNGWSLGRFCYKFAEAKRKNGEPVLFHLRGRSEELFLQAFVDEWQRLHGNRDWPSSKLLDEFCDPGAWKKRAGADED